MSNIQTYKPPLLAILEQKNKLRDYPIEKRLMIAKNLVVNLLSDLGVSAKADTNHHVRAIKYISESCVNYSAEEIEKAFSLCIGGEIKIDLFQQINALVVGKVIREYEIYKKENLKEYRRKMKAQQIKKQTYTEDEKENIMLEAVDRLQKEYNQNGEITGAVTHIYDYLFEKGLLPKHNKKFKDRILEKAKKIAKSEAMSEAGRDYNIHRQLDSMLKKIETGQSDKIKPISKRLVLEEYFKQSKL